MERPDSYEKIPCKKRKGRDGGLEVTGETPDLWKIKHPEEHLTLGGKKRRKKVTDVGSKKTPKKKRKKKKKKWKGQNNGTKTRTKNSHNTAGVRKRG